MFKPEESDSFSETDHNNTACSMFRSRVSVHNVHVQNTRVLRAAHFIKDLIRNDPTNSKLLAEKFLRLWFKLSHSNVIFRNSSL